MRYHSCQHVFAHSTTSFWCSISIFTHLEKLPKECPYHHSMVLMGYPHMVKPQLHSTGTIYTRQKHNMVCTRCMHVWMETMYAHVPPLPTKHTCRTQHNTPHYSVNTWNASFISLQISKNSRYKDSLLCVVGPWRLEIVWIPINSLPFTDSNTYSANYRDSLLCG